MPNDDSERHNCNCRNKRGFSDCNTVQKKRKKKRKKKSKEKKKDLTAALGKAEALI